VSANGKIVAFGAYLSGNFSAGSVKVFKRDKKSSLGWSQVGDTFFGDESSSLAGTSVALSSDGMIVAFGSPGDLSASGVVKVFRRDPLSSTGWTQEGKDIVGESPIDSSGESIALSSSGDTIVIGSPHHFHDNAPRIGHVRIFVRVTTEDIGWKQVGGPLEGDSGFDYAGDSVALSADGRIVAWNVAGSVRISKRKMSSPLGWEQIGEVIDSFGRPSLSADGLVVAGSRNGGVKVFETCENESPTSRPPETCVDDTTFKFNINAGTLKKCRWLNTDKRRENYCERQVYVCEDSIQLMKDICCESCYLNKKIESKLLLSKANND